MPRKSARPAPAAAWLPSATETPNCSVIVPPIAAEVTCGAGSAFHLPDGRVHLWRRNQNGLRWPHLKHWERLAKLCAEQLQCQSPAPAAPHRRQKPIAGCMPHQCNIEDKVGVPCGTHADNDSTALSRSHAPRTPQRTAAIALCN